MPLCPNCGEDNPDRARFCLACGRDLAAEPAPTRETRKTVTVLFADVTGSTALGELLDPEALRHVMARYFEEMKAVLERHGATVEKFIGDAVMAVFGIPAVHEDDALRAVRAAVDMRDALERLNESLERERGVSIAIRTGVNTGQVVAGDPAAGQALVTGDAVNTAARLEQAAQPGEVLIGEATRRLVRDAVTAVPVEPIAAKGKAEPVLAFRLIDVTPGTEGVVRRLDSPMVGREGEMRLLRQAFERSVHERACYLFTVLGSAGVGKSRLVQEFLAELEGQADALSGRCLPYGEGITFWPVAEVVRQAAGITEVDSPDEARARIAGLLETEEHGTLIGDRVSQVVGLLADSAVPEETFWAVRRFLEVLAAQRPLVAVLDDVHWGEPTFLDLLEHIADWSRDAPLLLLCVGRPDLLDHRPGWGGGKLNATSILLEPLDEKESGELVANLLGQASLSEEIRQRVTGAAEGNPLFVEQMLGMLIDDGLLVAEEGRWVPVGDLSDVAVPATIQALLAARLDRLTPDERAVIERASVVGRTFYRSAVVELSPEPERASVDQHLRALVRKELVRPERSELGAEDAFRFRHILLRDAAYGSMPKALRADLHERFAGWLERAAGERVREYEEILGYHLERAYRYLEELGPVDDRGRALAEPAAERLSSAGRRALARGDLVGGINLHRRAASLLTGEHRVEILLELAPALFELGELSEAEDVITEVLEHAPPGSALAARARLHRSFLRLNTDPTVVNEDVLKEAERAILVFEEAGDQRALSEAWSRLGITKYWTGRSADAVESLERAIAAAQAAGDHRALTETLSWLPWVLSNGPTPVAECLRRFDLIEELGGGDRRLEAMLYLVRSMMEGMLGHLEQARGMVVEGRAILEDLGSRVYGAAAPALATGVIETEAGDPGAAEPALREGYETLRSLGETGFLSTVASQLGHALHALGRDEEAVAFTEESERAAGRDDIYSQFDWRGARGKALAGMGQIDDGERLAREGLELARRTDFLSETGDRLMDLAEVLRVAGKLGEATDAVREAIGLYERKGNVASAGRARRVLSELDAGAR